MNSIKTILAIACAVAIVGSAEAATIFSDDFSDTNASKAKWNALAGSGFSASYSGGSLVLKNSDSIYTAFYMHIFPAGSKPSTFTLSAAITIADTGVNGAGLGYCLNSVTSLIGYTLQLVISQYLYCQKYSSSGYVDLKKKYCLFVKPFPSTNIIAVSKIGSIFNVFCNGHYVTRFSDNGYTGGDISLIIPPKSTIKVNSVLMTDQPQIPPSSACYADSFLTTASDAWSTPSAGLATFGGGHLVLNNTDPVYSSTIYTDGISPTASIKAVASHVSGTGGYGVAFVQSDSNVATPFAFLVDSARHFAIVNPDSSTVTSYLGSGIMGALGSDTLEVRQFGKYWKYLVNGALQDSVTIPSDFRVDGFGLYANRQTAAGFGYFVAGGDSTGAVCAASPVISLVPSPQSRSIAPVFGKGSTVYDVMGRRVGVFDRISFARANLTRGVYFVMAGNQKVGSVKAFPVMKTGN